MSSRLDQIRERDARLDALKLRAAEVTFRGSAVEAANGIMRIARQIRRECRGQSPVVPDLSTRGASSEGVLVHDWLPELAARLILASGEEVSEPAGRLANPDLAHMSDRDLRLAIGDALRFSMLGGAAMSVRLNAGPGEIRDDRLLAVELLARKVAEGNVVEIATSRLCPPLERSDPAHARDWLAREIERSRKAAGIGVGGPAWCPEIDAAPAVAPLAIQEPEDEAVAVPAI
ncbi:hypothetical protein [Defluviimonas salinarum]|uniref:Uncharacterized protein n=1 Tax=Defluviimonas salinarum TaxID=2992147 RepID=A0ABT3JB53_9RHOB|nr:hypothetical protein [Defluviimonas salinarum]MCW3784660.1 hypothetical protein [Defluviimonas salinarum]